MHRMGSLIHWTPTLPRRNMRENGVPEIELSDVEVGFGRESVLRDICFTANTGDFVALLGASGCGKSTLLRLIAGLLNPTSGTLKRSETDVGFVFQKPTLCPWLTVTQNVQMPLALGRVALDERARIASEAIRLVGLQATDAEKYPYQLSGGMQMRVSIARAFVTKPRIMLMDEPFSALDEVLRQQLAETSLELWQRESWTTVFVTHNVAEAVFLSQRIHILAGKPATIVDTIEIPFANRDGELRTSAEYIQLVTEVSLRLRRAVEVAAAEGSPT